MSGEGDVVEEEGASEGRGTLGKLWCGGGGGGVKRREAILGSSSLATSGSA